MLGKMMTVDQPAKLAAAEGALEDTSDFSLVRFSDLSGEEVYFELKVPGVLGFIAGKDEIKGVDTIRKEFAEQGILNYDGEKNKLQEQYADELATKVAEMQAAGYDIDPIPSIVVSYWTFRLMIGMGLLGTLIGLYVLWVTRKGRAPKPSKLWTTLMIAAPLLPLFAISFGWIFTEMGRQPWIVYGVMPTQLGISPTVSVAEVALTMVLYTLIYGGLAVIEVSLFWKYANEPTTTLRCRSRTEPRSK
ncbi:MAG: hypothetical protein CSA64_00070 [Arachnia propionica]|nr:MAG: hypothetical protein CSA64_00070 [Arachnia propionica]